MFSVHHQESSTVHTAIGICHTGYADCLLAGSGWSSSLIPLASNQHNLYRGADKSLARPGRKQATATKL